MGAYFCAYKCDVVVAIEMGAYIHGMLIFYGCLLSWFYGMYRSLAKKGPLMKERQPPTFCPISCYRVKVYSNERPPWSELRVEFEKHGLECYVYLREETLCNTSPKLIQGIFA